MSPYELTALATLIANTIASRLNDCELDTLVILTRHIYENLTAIVVQKNINKKCNKKLDDPK